MTEAFHVSRAALPVVLLVGVTGLATLALRMRQGPASDAYDRTARDAFLVAALAAIVVLTLIPKPDDVGRIELLPFADLIRALTLQTHVRTEVLQIIGNVALFIPLGMGLRWRFARLSVAHIGLAAVVLSAGIEVIQAVAIAGRIGSTTDVIMNALGGLIGALVAARLARPG